MRMYSLCFLVCLVWNAVSPVQGQWFDSLVNPDVEVTLAHPPGLGIRARRVAFAPVQSAAADELVSACIADLTRNGQLEVLDRSNIDRILKEQKFTNSGLVDEGSAIELGRMLGSPLLLMVNVHHLKVSRTPHRTTKPEWKDSKGKIHPAITTYISTTRIDYSASVQAVDLASGRVYSQQRIVLGPSRESVSEAGQPDFPTESEVREAAIEEAVLQVHRMLLPWNETRKLIFYDDREYGMKDAYKRLKQKDTLAALAASEKVLAAAKADKNVRDKFLGRAHYNLGICHFILGDYATALPYLRTARETDPDHKIFLEALRECERAIQLAAEMARAEARSQPPTGTLPATQIPKAPGGTIEERLEQLERLRKKGLITQPEYEKRKAEILAEI